jgi:hypothetical protein
MVRGLEDSKMRLSVGLIQLSSTDPATDKVTATVGVNCFGETPKAEKAKEEAPRGKA